MELRCCGTGSTGNAYAIVDDEDILLIECGVPWKKILKMIDYRLSDVRGCLMSHRHIDHSLCYKKLMESGVPIYTNDETVEYFEVTSGELMTGLPEKRTINLENKFEITPFYVPHDDVPNYAFIIELSNGSRLLYATDFLLLPYRFKKMRLNHLLIECNHNDELVDKNEVKFEHSLRGHSSLSVVKEIIRANKTSDLQNIALCHLSEDWSNPDVMLQGIKKVAGSLVNVEIINSGSVISLDTIPF